MTKKEDLRRPDVPNGVSRFAEGNGAADADALRADSAGGVGCRGRDQFAAGGHADSGSDIDVCAEDFGMHADPGVCQPVDAQCVHRSHAAAVSFSASGDAVGNFEAG